MDNESANNYSHAGILDLIQEPGADMEVIYNRVSALQADAQRVLEENMALRDQMNQHLNGSSSSSQVQFMGLANAVETVAQAQAEAFTQQSSYQANMERIIEALAARQAVSPNGRMSTPSPLTTKFKGPDGEMSFLEFKAKLYSQQERFPAAFSTDADKIMYAFQCMEGAPSRYVSVYVNDPSSDSEGILTNYTKFLEVVGRVFGDQNNREDAEYKIQRLRQANAPIHEYILKFRELAAQTEWNTASLLARFKDGLSIEVKTILSPQWFRLATMEDTISAATQAQHSLQLQNRFRPRQSAQNNHPAPRRFVAPAAAPGASSGAGPMDLDAVSFKKIAPEDRQRRMDLRLCLYCGGAGHQVRGCPVKKPIHANVMTAEDDEEENAEART
jgi:hypothetical protein